MTDEIVKHGGFQSAIQTLRLVMAIDTEEATAIAKSAVKDGTRGLVARGMSVLQRWNEDRFGNAFLDELEDMKRAGQIREDFHQTDAGASSLREIFELIDGKPDEERFHAFCALFMGANAPGADSNEGIFDVELMGILRGLSAGEMHLLSAFLKVRMHVVGRSKIMDSLANELGYKSDALVHRNVAALLNHGLIDRNTWTNLGGHVGTEKQLLTDLGMALNERIKKYNEFKAREKAESASK